MNRKLLTLALLALPFLVQAQNPPPKRELRGAWIATFSNIDWPSRTATPASQQATLLTILNHHQQTGMNAVFLQVRSQSDALYPSTIEPWSADLTGTQGRAPSPAWDPLQFAITETRRRGMEFHAWLNPYRAASNSSSIANFAASHVTKQHPEWLLTVGTNVILNPGLPQVRDYITSVIVDIVTRYDIDGLHFDDYFYPNGTINDNDAFNADPRGFTVRADWRRDNVNLLIKRVYDTIKALKPWVKFGVSPSGIYRNSSNPAIGTPTSGLEHYTTLYADTKKWLEQGWIDYLAPQVYWYMGQPGANYSLIVPWWSSVANGRHIYIGMAGYKVNDATQGAPWTQPSMFPNEVRLNRQQANVQGQIVYNTSSLRATTRLGFRDSLRLFFYQKPALIPTMPWRDNTPPNAASGLTAQRYGNDSVVLRWSLPAAATELDQVRRVVVYRSASPTIDLNDANNIVAITVNDTTAFRDVTITAGSNYFYTVTTVDRFYNESGASNVVADLPPSILCPGEQSIDLDATCAIAVPDYTTLATTANASSVSQVPAPGTMLTGKGMETITLTATNAVGQTASCTFSLAKQDVTPPVIANASTDPSILWAPNHRMEDVTVAYDASDACGPVTTSLSVSSNERSRGLPDWIVIDEHHLKLRAERNGNGDGRVYTITIRAEDASGNVSTQTVTVTVPHDQSDITVNKPFAQGVEGWKVDVAPNPTSSEFRIRLSSAREEAFSITVYDAAGRQVEQRRGQAAGTVVIGRSYRSGVYYAEIRQGGQRQIIKLVKTE